MTAVVGLDYTLRVVAAGTTVLGAAAGAVGVFAVLRRQSLLGDAISHAALPGIVGAFLLTGRKDSVALVLGAAIAGWLAALFVDLVVRTSRIPQDSALGIALSGFFGAGLLLLTHLQRTPRAAQAGLDSFLFGQAATLVASEVRVIAVLGLVIAGALLAFWKELKLLAFDREFAASCGFPVRVLEAGLTFLLVLAIVTGLQAVGVVLMSSLVVAPAVAARQWSSRLGAVVLLAAVFGGGAGAAGALLSTRVERLPTGPTIVLVVTGVVGVSVTLAPERGLLWAAVRARRRRRVIRKDSVLVDLFRLFEQHRDPAHGHSVRVLEAMGEGRGAVSRTLEVLEGEGLARRASGGWALTPAGLARAARLAAHDGGEP